MNVTITKEGQTKEYAARRGQTILTLLQKNRISGIEAPCGGMGRCGKCKVEIVGRGEVLPSASAAMGIASLVMAMGIVALVVAVHVPMALGAIVVVLGMVVTCALVLVLHAYAPLQTSSNSSWMTNGWLSADKNKYLTLSTRTY